MAASTMGSTSVAYLTSMGAAPKVINPITSRVITLNFG
jgi:hypothetical protein